MEEKVITMPTLKTMKKNDLSVIIFLYKDPNFDDAFSKPFDLEICGKKMWKWVEMACEGYPVKTTLCTPTSDVLELIKPMLTTSKFTLVLYSDTPLMAVETIRKILNYAKKHNSEFLKLERGFLFNTEFAKTATKIPEVMEKNFDENAFFVVDTLDKFEFVNQILKEHILQYNEDNGVCIMDKRTTFIDADCEIESGVIIYPNNSILGNTYIHKNAVLNSGNIIISSDIGERAILNGAYIKNSKIGKKQEIGAFERIVDK